VGWAEEEAQLVSVVTSVREPLVSTLELTGSVTALRQASLSSRTEGLIADLKVDAGDVVKAGDVLMELDDELARIALETVMVEGEEAELQLAEARRLDTEARQLVAKGAFARSEADTRETSVKVAEAALKGSDVAAKQQRAVIERHRLIAPFDGVVSEKMAEAGEWVQTGTPVVVLVETGNLRMDVQAPQELFSRLSSNPEMEVRLDSHPGKPLAGKIAVIVPVKDPVARTFLARVEMEDPDGLASPGMSGRVSFRFTGDEAVQVPRDALVRFPDGTVKLWIVTEENGRQTARSKSVKVGETLTEMIEVTEGLDAGEKVITRGNEGMREGQVVEIAPAEIPVGQ
jgi:RND family efflux transporter MFP subunit